MRLARCRQYLWHYAMQFQSKFERTIASDGSLMDGEKIFPQQIVEVCEKNPIIQCRPRTRVRPTEYFLCPSLQQILTESAFILSYVAKLPRFSAEVSEFFEERYDWGCAHDLLFTSPCTQQS